MPTFAEKVKQAELSELPVVEGYAAALEEGEDPAALALLLAQRLAGEWQPAGAGWLVYRYPADAKLPELGEAWNFVRKLKGLAGIRHAEPMLIAAQALKSGPEAQRQLAFWGWASEERLEKIRLRSLAEKHWSLEQLALNSKKEENGEGKEEGNGRRGGEGAWDIWRAKDGRQAKAPGEGILIAHLDTGYTPHPRLIGCLAHREEDPEGHYGRNFVEREGLDAGTDGRDPMEDRVLLHMPGHGTSTLSIIAAPHGEEGEPWGVAPGAKILPLRVSSSVIHFSFQNVCDAFLEAFARGAQVITMSLGGPYASQMLKERVQEALDRGILVIAAAGNNMPTVVFPARLPGVIACAASNILESAWRFSGLGAEVAITAPGELVWHHRADTFELAGEAGSGTSYATAHVAGLAALWLSHYGREALLAHCGRQARLLPFLFRYCLQKSARHNPPFLRGGKGGFGAGIAQANNLLRRSLPKVELVEAEYKRSLTEGGKSVTSFPLRTWGTIFSLPTLTANGPIFAEGKAEEASRLKRAEGFLAGKHGLVPGGLDETDQEELMVLVASDILLTKAFAIATQNDCRVPASALRRVLLEHRDEKLSSSLREKLQRAQDNSRNLWLEEHAGLLPAIDNKMENAEAPDNESTQTPGNAPQKIPAYAIGPPPLRRLRAYAFDPSLALSSTNVAINELILEIPFEPNLGAGPVGEYLEVVDVDPASDCAYAPVDLNHPHLLAQDGLPRSEGNPQFHQQMVYAVAMKTISLFEEALGRPVFWSHLRPWNVSSGDSVRARKIHRKVAQGKDVDDDSDQFVQRLRLYPHALRGQNAYYSPAKRAILFGYFPAGDSDPGAEYPGGVVFTCLAYDIIAHEMTHAILDGMHVSYSEPTNPDVFAFHEAFADIVALFQRFSYPDLLRDQIAKSRGRLEVGTLMTRLALQFGQATGRHQALRDALGYVMKKSRAQQPGEWRTAALAGGERDRDIARALEDAGHGQFSDETRYVWARFQADPAALASIEEPHLRGSFLVAAVFDAYITIYESRVADLKRIATGGTGILPDGDLHPDLVQRMADEAAKSARHVLRMCIRAMDYVPPTDITFGEFLRALITADADLVPVDNRRYRVAFIEAFRKWGIYPRDVRTLSEETLRWSPPSDQVADLPDWFNTLRPKLFGWKPGDSREELFDTLKEAQRRLWKYLGDIKDGEPKQRLLGGIDTRRTFQVTNLRSARRVGPGGELRTELVVEILQSSDARPTDPAERNLERKRRSLERKEQRERGEDDRLERIPFRGGTTLIISVEQDCFRVRYAIYKRFDSVARQARQRDYLLRAGANGSGATEYSSDGLPAGWYSQEEVRKEWKEKRNGHLEAMRASSCSCRRLGIDGTKMTSLAEPFALLHRG